MRTYLAIDLKSFYASVECVERGLDPLDVNLVVADKSRTEKTICLAVSPALKSYGVPGRPRLFEVVQKVRNLNGKRRCACRERRFQGSSVRKSELETNPQLEMDYLVAVPRMALYLEYSTRIYEIYMKYVAPEDCHVYSIDEVMLDVTDYLGTYQMSANELASEMIREVYEKTGITATAGIGANLYLAKVAMDIKAKHVTPNRDSVRIAELDEISYRRELWDHQPITDFWRVGRGYAKKLEQYGIYTMGDVAACSVERFRPGCDMELLYRLFGINAELLIDHAWGIEPCTMADIKSYQPVSESMGAGQVLSCPYSAKDARIVVREMTETLSSDLVEKHLMTDRMVLTVGYDIQNLQGTSGKRYRGEVKRDRYGRLIPKHAHGTVRMDGYTSSGREMMEKMLELYDRIADPALPVRRVTLSAERLQTEQALEKDEQDQFEQLDLFTDYQELEQQKEQEKIQREKEKRLQEATLVIKKRYGKNAILKGTNYQEGATMRERNQQIGGHRA